MRTSSFDNARISFGPAILFTILWAGSLQAQTFGEISGRVSDPSGAAVPGTSVTVTNTATNASRQTVSTEAGDFTFPSLSPGLYRVRMQHGGFKALTSDNIEVQVQQSVHFDATLQIGQVSDTVEVSANADLLQAENATVGAVVENKMINELPLNGRQYLNLVALAPNVNTLSPTAGQAASRQGGDRANQAISTGGQRIMFDYYTLDGVNNTDPNFNTYIVLPSIDAIQEFKVQIGVYPAEFGHQSTQVNVLTKSGGNSYHGALFEFLRNNQLDAVPYAFSAAQHVPTAPFKWNDFGFELDGPVRIPKLYNGHDKLFFMANYEALRRRQNFTANYTVPTAAMFGGDFSSLLTQAAPIKIYDPNNKQQFPNNVIPATRLDPVSLRLLKYYPTATIASANQNYTQFNSSPSNRDGLVLRMDFVESSKSQWNARYSWGDENQASQGLTVTGSKILTNYEQYSVTNVRTFTPNIVNEARYGYTRFFNSIGTALAFDTDVVGQANIPGLKGGAPVTWGVPFVGFNGAGGYTAIGDSTDGPYANDNNTLQLLDKLSWTKGKHTFRFGFEYNRQNYNQVGNQFSRGSFTFQANATQDAAKTGGYAFSEFLLGDIFASTVAVAIADAQFQRNAEAAFFDDTWKVTPKLTVSLGLRYELTPPFTDTLGDYFTVAVPKITFDPNTAQSDYPFFVRQGNCQDPYAGLNIRWTSTKAVCSNGLLNNNLLQTKYKNFAPRIGIAYSLDPKTVIRTGLGIFYNQDTGNATYFDMARNIAARVTLTADPGAANLPWANAIPGGGGALAQVPPPYAYVADYNHATSYTTQYLFNVQRQFGQDYVVELGYLGSESHHLYGFQNLNQALPGTTGSIASRTAYKNYGVIQYVSTGLNAVYNSGSVKLTRRFSRGISGTTSYTFSKSIDNSSGIRNQGFDTLFPQDNRCLSCERALSAFDTRHRFVLAGSYDLPVGKGKSLDIKNGFLDALIGGWQTSGQYTLQSGVPQTLTIGGVDNASTGNQGTDRPNYTGIGNGIAADQTPSRWYDPASFSKPIAGTFGNVGRNTMITPHFRALDFAVHKNFRMPVEGHFLQFRAEAFNVLNHPSWGAPNGNITAAGFGVIGATAIPMRQLQLGLKYSF
jgi:Carboxypeptidase regulatory-like domain